MKTLYKFIVSVVLAIKMQNIPLQENCRTVGAVDQINEEYLQRMSTSGEWGDGIILASACRLYQRDIHVILENGQKVVFSVSSEWPTASNAPIYLGFRNSHYTHLTPKVQVSVTFVYII